MTTIGWLQIALFAALVGLLTRPVGGYLARVYNRERTLLQPLFGPIENAIYRVGGIEPGAEQGWKAYAISLLAFHAFGIVVLYALLRLQPYSCGLIHQSFRRPHQIWHSTLR